MSTYVPTPKTLCRVLSTHQTYKAMEKIYQSGKAKAIGISNFSKYEMENLLKKCNVTPAVHQIECHPWLQQREFIEWHRGKGIHMTHYSALGNQNEIYGNAGQKVGKMIDEPILQEVAKKHGKSSAQVAIGECTDSLMICSIDPQADRLSSLGSYPGPLGAVQV